eukprot:TRINITY_DN779_c0_g2_i1.p1 TRINITY_DN779_c0_g2~~TRINITY_DN779_c0_g2_i1.p1  ORF type:complete len:381 (+),score=101.75 TRINITY_DN779_c0_g2_i1:52-1194(+)
MKFLCIFALIAVAFATKECKNGGVLVDNCCVCETGYTGTLCDECSAGFVMLNGKCGNGRDGTACTDDGAFPFFGCGGVGSCSFNNQSEKVFPCKCTDIQQHPVSCADKLVGLSSCAPAGPRMYTPFPNAPQQDKAFSLTVLGCKMMPTPSILLIPAFKEDGLTPNECDGKTGEFAGLDPSCVIGNDAEANATVNVECREGVVLNNLAVEASGGNDMAEYTFAGLVVSKDNFYISGTEIAGTHNRNQFKVCTSSVEYVVPGQPETEIVWNAVDTHNTGVDSRTPEFHILGLDDMHPRGAGSLEGEAGGDCCDGLKIGFCLPLWAFLLLWLLMALCLGFLGFALHKNKNEIEAKKNNEKYEKFNTDAEMIEHAAKEADDDDI